MPLGALGMQAASGAIDAGMGLILGAYNDRRQLKQQQKLTNMQVAAQRGLTDHSYNKQYEMWEKTNYAAQREQMEKAGLNPGLLYGMSGGGGATTGTAGSTGAGAGTAPSGGGEVQSMMGMGMQRMQLQLLQAQKENIEADTKNKLTDAGYTGGPKTDNTIAGTENIKAGTKKTGTETKGIELDNELKSRTMEDAVEYATWHTQRELEEVDRAARENFINKATQEAQIKEIKANAAGAILRNILTRAQTDNTKAGTANIKQQTVESQQRVGYMVQKLMIEWDQLSIQERDYEVRKVATEFQQDPSREIMNVITQAVDGIFRMQSHGTPRGTKPPEVKGFR